MPELGVPFVIRIPLVPCITDTNENLSAIAATIRPLPGLIRIDLLPYNRAAGGKYGPLGMEFRPPFDESQPVNANCDIFADMGVSVNVPGRDRL
jgi:pyruvate formate lyase activating enzyme